MIRFFRCLRPVVLAAALAISLPAGALILVGRNEPLHDPGWPAGALPLANLPSRFAYLEGPPFGGGDWTLQFHGGTTELQAALDAFAAIKADRLEVALHEGPGTDPFGAGPNDPSPEAARTTDWTVELWVPERWRALYNTPTSLVSAGSPNFGRPLAAPRLDVWLHAGGPDWSAIHLSGHLVVTDQRASAHGFPGGQSVIDAFLRDARTGQPLPAATVALTGPRGATNRTDDQGHVVLRPDGPATGPLVAHAAGYASRVLDPTGPGPNEYRTLTMSLARGVSLRGIVRDHRGRPLPGVSVRARNTIAPDGTGYVLPEAPAAETDAAGHFELSGLPAGGALQVWAHRTGYQQEFDPGARISLSGEPGDPPVDIEVNLIPTGALLVRLVDDSGKPRTDLRAGSTQVHLQAEAGAVVGSYGGSADLRADGTAEFSQVPPGHYRVSTHPFPGGIPPAPSSGRLIEVTAGATNRTDLRSPPE